MATEIERRFKVIDSRWEASVTRAARVTTQGYLSKALECVVPARAAGERGALTIKGATNDLEHAELEYTIPIEDAHELLRELCIKPLVEKTRYDVPLSEFEWEIDVFHPPHDGLVSAENELPTADFPFHRPAWLGKDATGDPRVYYQNITFPRP
jgi:adenylate cyclase